MTNKQQNPDEVTWVVKAFERLGPTFFEAFSVAMLSVAINVFTTLAMERTPDSELCRQIICFGIIVLAIASFGFSMLLFRFLSKIFREQVTSNARITKLRSPAHKKEHSYFVWWLTSAGGFIGLVILLFVMRT